MALQDREAIVATVEETYALMGRAVATDIPSEVIERSVRPEIMEQIRLARVDPYVTDEEMLGLLREAYFGLVENVLRVHEELLSEQGERYDPYLENAGLTGNGRAVKVRGFRRAIEWLRDAPGIRWVKKAFEWGNIILGSLGGVPVVGVVSDPVRELKEAIDDDQTA
jgi:hypothetical protein